MIKITIPNSWSYDQPVASLIDVHRGTIDTDTLEKRAAAGIFKHADLKPDPGHALIHLIALGDAEVYGGNRNGDWFFGSPRQLELSEPNWDRVLLKEANEDKSPRYHTKSPDTFTNMVSTGNDTRIETFVKYANVYKNHKNKPYLRPDDKSEVWKKMASTDRQQLVDLCIHNAKGAEKFASARGLKLLEPDKTYGTIKAAAHNKVMARGELMIQVPFGVDWDSDLEKLANNEDIPWSMASKVPHDICLTCGHKAPRIEDYCPHVAQFMTEMTKVGHMHGVANDIATFFDISRVYRPADRIAWSLYGITKAAAAGSMPVGQIEKLAAALALDPEFEFYPPVSVLGLHLPARVRSRLDLMTKAAEIEKTVPAIAASGSSLARGATVKPTLAPGYVKMATYKLPSFFRALSDRNVCLPIEKWAEVVLGDRYVELAEHVKRAQVSLPGAFTRLLGTGDQIAANTAYDPDNRTPELGLRKTASSLERSYAMTPEATASRAVENVIRGNEPSVRLAQSANAGDPISEGLVRDYVSYKLAFLAEVQRTQPQFLDFVLEAAVLQNHV